MKDFLKNYFSRKDKQGKKEIPLLSICRQIKKLVKHDCLKWLNWENFFVICYEV